MRTTSQSGFSLLEMLIVLIVLTVVMGAVISQITQVQKHYQAEEQKLDVSQESREFIDQLVRDLHQAGYPSAKMFAAGVLLPAGSPQNDRKNAVGIVKFAYDEVWFEGDVDGDGNVEVVDYKLQPDAGNVCPCRISRSIVQKIDDAPMSQNHTNYTTELQDVVNSGGANGGASGTAAYTIVGNSHFGSNTVANDGFYATFKTANVFTAYDDVGNLIAPTDYATNKALLAKIRTIKINLNLLARNADLQSARRPAVTLSAAAQIPAN